MSPAERERRAIQAANTAQRKASDNGAARRASGQAMIARRTGQSQADDINAIVNVPRPRKTLRTVEPRGPLLGQTGTGTYTPPPAGSPGGGIASPLIEVSAAQREYFPEALIPTTDGLAWAKMRSVKKLVMADANNAEVVMEFKDDTQQPG